MTELNIEFNDDNYKSLSIASGKNIKKFITELSKNVFKQSFDYYKATSDAYMPILCNERNMSSTLSVAIDKITKAHLSEWCFHKEELNRLKRDKNFKIIDFWCMTPNGVNYFIELKHGHFCSSKGCDYKLEKIIKNRVDKLKTQIIDIKKIKPNWSDINDIPLGIMVIKNFYNKTHGSVENSANILHKDMAKTLNNKNKLQMFSATWFLPDEIKKAMQTDNEGENRLIDWVSIFYFTFAE